MDGLTDKQAAFVREYLIDLNATRAAIRAGYSPASARVIGPENLSKPAIADAIEVEMAKRAARVEVTADEVLRELKRVALMDPRQAYTETGRLRPMHEMPDDIARAIAGVETEELWESTGEDGKRAQVGDVRKLKFWPKVQALELLGKHLKLFTDKQEVMGEGGGPVVFHVDLSRGRK